MTILFKVGKEKKVNKGQTRPLKCNGDTFEIHVIKVLKVQPNMYTCAVPLSNFDSQHEHTVPAIQSNRLTALLARGDFFVCRLP